MQVPVVGSEMDVIEGLIVIDLPTWYPGFPDVEGGELTATAKLTITVDP